MADYILYTVIAFQILAVVVLGVIAWADYKGRW